MGGGGRLVGGGGGADSGRVEIGGALLAADVGGGGIPVGKPTLLLNLVAVLVAEAAADSEF